MTRDEEIWYERRRELLKMIREAGISTDSHPMNELRAYPEQFERFAELVAKAERDAVVADAERYRWLRDTFSTAKAGAILSVNKPLMVYEEPDLGSTVRLQWFPHTPSSFIYVTTHSLDAAIDAAKE